MSRKRRRRNQPKPPIHSKPVRQSIHQAKAANIVTPEKPSIFSRFTNIYEKRKTIWSKKQIEKSSKFPVYTGIKITVIGSLIASIAFMLLQQHVFKPIENPPVTPTQDVVMTIPPDHSFVPASLLMPLSTRSGPSIRHDETGTYFPYSWENQTVQVLGKFWENEIWWVLVDFTYNDQARYRVWTGSKRIKVDITKLDEVKPMYSAVALATHDTYRGPGTDYAKAGIDVPDKTDVVVYGRENGFTEIEYDQDGKKHRLWVPENYVY